MLEPFDDPSWNVIRSHRKRRVSIEVRSNRGYCGHAPTPLWSRLAPFAPSTACLRSQGPAPTKPSSAPELVCIRFQLGSPRTAEYALREAHDTVPGHSHYVFCKANGGLPTD
eukprot:1028676-Prorocentrum_minimum.AAC.3